MKKDKLIQEVNKKLDGINSALEYIKDICADIDDELGTFAEDWLTPIDEFLDSESVEALIEKIEEIYEQQEDEE